MASIQDQIERLLAFKERNKFSAEAWNQHGLNPSSTEQPCTQCGKALEAHVIRREEGIPETSWFIVKCNHCGELNLLSHGPGIKETRFGNYQWVEQLRMSEYSYEQALVRLEQVKVFRT